MGKKLYDVYMSEYYPSANIELTEVTYVKSSRSSLYYSTNINNINGYTLR
ncbi:MAG: hypothetical protein ACRDD8_13345 [Bacteroidales bacterium]